ncbi:hypothetical protein HBN50_09265 [Halobacteriovorax sp. GB3]|uniref:hypothetical protein n=1 Tax=Halobacteriovorax sp. GB3 TaxID=2719615 RepID=UPI00235E2D82|nr:hypothetical protein [Halobacteriovorax sp. GB3]MDD0853287.1 hypothetical protein [Halobacteriovorax sp. GB3]
MFKRTSLSRYIRFIGILPIFIVISGFVLFYLFNDLVDKKNKERIKSYEQLHHTIVEYEESLFRIILFDFKDPRFFKDIVLMNTKHFETSKMQLLNHITKLNYEYARDKDVLKDLYNAVDKSAYDMRNLIRIRREIGNSETGIYYSIGEIEKDIVRKNQLSRNQFVQFSEILSLKGHYLNNHEYAVLLEAKEKLRRLNKEINSPSVAEYIKILDHLSEAIDGQNKSMRLFLSKISRSKVLTNRLFDDSDRIGKEREILTSFITLFSLVALVALSIYLVLRLSLRIQRPLNRIQSHLYDPKRDWLHPNEGEGIKELEHLTSSLRDYEKTILKLERKQERSGKVISFSKIASSLSHEVRNPLAIILAKAKHISRIPISTNQQVEMNNSIESIKKQVLKITELFDSLWELKGTKEDTSSMIQTKNVEDFLRPIYEGLQQKFKEEGIIFNISGKIDELTIHGHFILLEQAIMLLLEDSKKRLTGSTKKVIWLRVMANRNNLFFLIRDTADFSLVDKKSIFAFNQIEKIIKMHSGKLWTKGDKREGQLKEYRFIIQLPKKAALDFESRGQIGA